MNTMGEYVDIKGWEEAIVCLTRRLKHYFKTETPM